MSGTKKLLLVVEDAFTVSGRGLIVFPFLTLEVIGNKKIEHYQPIAVRLIHRDGTQDETEAKLGFEHFNPGGYHLFCIFPNATKEQIPIGTEIWLLEDLS